jgi:hypothetical protein
MTNNGFLRRLLLPGEAGADNTHLFQQDAAANNGLSAFLAEFPTTELFCPDKDDKLHRVSIDTAKLPRVLEVSTRWRVSNFYPRKFNKRVRLYAHFNATIWNHRLTVYLHRLVADCPPDKEVDHSNDDSLDNRDRKVRVVTHRQNMLNRVDRAPKTDRWKQTIWQRLDAAQVVILEKLPTRLKIEHPDIPSSPGYGRIRYFYPLADGDWYWRMTGHGKDHRARGYLIKGLSI